MPPCDEARVAVLFVRLEGDREDEAGEEEVPEEEVDDEEEGGDGSPLIVRREEVGEIDSTEEDPQLVPGEGKDDMGDCMEKDGMDLGKEDIQCRLAIEGMNHIYVLCCQC